MLAENIKQETRGNVVIENEKYYAQCTWYYKNF